MITNGHLLKQIDNALEARINKTLRGCNITASQSRVLGILYESEEGECHLKELEVLLGVSQPTCFGIIKRLVEKGYVTCFTTEANRKLKRVKLTESGRICLMAVSDQSANEEERLFSCLSEAEAKQFRSSLMRIKENLEEGDRSEE